MKKQSIFLAASLALASFAGTAQQSHPGAGAPRAAAPQPVFSTDAAAERIENVDTPKAELKQYHDCTCKCGCYAHDLDTQADRAIAFLRKRAAQHKAGEKLALVLDIDETSLSNYQELLKLDFGFDKPAFDAWALSAQAPAIPGTLRLFKEARRLGVAVFFITGRPQDERDATERNLRAQGFGGWQQLTLRDQTQQKQLAEVYKSAVRAQIAAQGYTLALNVGDQWSDLKDAPEAEYNVKYPNPFYYIP